MSTTQTTEAPPYADILAGPGDPAVKLARMVLRSYAGSNRLGYDSTDAALARSILANAGEVE